MVSRKRMATTGTDFLLDCHGGEELRCVVFGEPLRNPSQTPRLTLLYAQFERASCVAEPTTTYCALRQHHLAKRCRTLRSGCRCRPPLPRHRRQG